MTVAVVMSTFNGEKYLREQLDSILNQQGVAVTLYIRDDGSSDGTKEILSEYEKINNNVYVDYAQNVGVGNSFMNALYSVPDTYEFYAFADQDDIWQEEKLSEAIKFLIDRGKSLYASNQENVDSEGNSLGLRWEKDDERVFLSPEGITATNVLCGCTMVMTGEFKKLICEENRRPSSTILKIKNHDGWIATVGAVYDGLVYDNRSFIKYRQHGGNVVGAYKPSFFKKMKQRGKKLLNRELRSARSRQSGEVCEKFPDKALNFPLLQICACADSMKGKKEIIKHQAELCKFTNESKMTFKLKVYLGLF